MGKRRVISQREARRTDKALRELEQKYYGLTNRYAGNYPGVHIRQNIGISENTQTALNVAVQLGFSLAAKLNGLTLDIYAIK